MLQEAELLSGKGSTAGGGREAGESEEGGPVIKPGEANTARGHHGASLFLSRYQLQAWGLFSNSKLPLLAGCPSGVCPPLLGEY